VTDQTRAEQSTPTETENTKKKQNTRRRESRTDVVERRVSRVGRARDGDGNGTGQQNFLAKAQQEKAVTTAMAQRQLNSTREEI
jgi:hypothetical protein